VGVPEALIQQFRTVAIDRLGHIEAAWTQIQEHADESAAATIHREVHTLKGESKMLGFADVNLICHKTEELLDLARVNGYAVDAEVDFAINMALQFMAMLVRKQAAAPLGGIDLQGFLRQIETILADARQRKRGSSGSFPRVHASATPTVSTALRGRLGSVAIDAFVEYAAATGARRKRLVESWRELRELLGVRAATLHATHLDKYVAGARSLARELGKKVEVTVELASAQVTPTIIAAVDAAMIHLVRNAVDHGIELPGGRAAAGKPAAGRVAIRGELRDRELVLEVRDDGAGVSLERVRARALELGLVSPTTDIASCWIDLVCAPGFSTRRAATEVSGRGVGLDAVRSAIVDIGGTLGVTTELGRGTSWQISIPVPALAVTARALRVPNVPFPIAIDRSWHVGAEHSNVTLVDVAAHLGLARPQPGHFDAYFSRGRDTVGFHAELGPLDVEAQWLVQTPSSVFAEIVVIDGDEGLLLRPDRLTG
jgi:two-component system chemotaxis sensor kinase CheA